MSVAMGHGGRCGAAATCQPVAALAISAVAGLPEIEPGDDLAALIAGRGRRGRRRRRRRDVEDRVQGRGPHRRAGQRRAVGVRHRVGDDVGQGPASSRSCCASRARIVRMVGPVLITETHHGFVCANSGIDQSSSGAAGRVVLLPDDSDASARRHPRRRSPSSAPTSPSSSATRSADRGGRDRPTSPSASPASPRSHSYIGQVDPHGHEFRVQELCVVDELAGAAELVKGNTVAGAGGRHPRLRVGARRHGVDAPRDPRPAHDLFR